MDTTEGTFASGSSSEEEVPRPQTRYYLRLRTDGIHIGQRVSNEDSSDEEETEEERVSLFRSNPLLMLLRNLAGSVGASRRQSRRAEINSSTTSDKPQCQRSRKTPKQEPAQVNAAIPVSEDIVQQVRQQCGIACHSSSTASTGQRGQPLNLLQKLHQREHGRADMLLRVSTASEQRSFNEHFLPNVLSMVQLSSSPVYVGKYSKNGELFLSTNQAGTIAVYSCERDGFALLRNIQARYVGWAVLETALSPDGCSLAYCTWCPLLHHCNIFGDSVNHHALDLRPEEHSFGVFGLTYSYDGMELMASGTDGCFYVYDLYKGERVLRVPSHEDHVDALCSDSDNSHMLYSGADDGLCKVWDRRTLSEERPLPVGRFAGHRDGITFIDIKGDGRYLISNSKDQSVKLWDMRKFSSSEAIQATRKAVARQMWDYRWQGAPPYLLKKMKESKLSGDSSVMTYIGHTVRHTLIRCRFSPSHTTGQRYIYTGGGNGTAVVYDVLTGDIVRQLCNPQRKVVRDVSWHPYRQELAASCWSQAVNVWTPSRLQMACSDIPEEEEESSLSYNYYDSSD